MTRGVAAVEAAFHGKTAFIAYLMTGHPDVERFLASVDQAFAAGADILEMGVPYSDPVADGPVIQAAGEAALRNGIDLARALELAGTLRARHEQPILLMCYLNPLHVYGFDRFLAEAKRRGVDGVIIPDLPLDEADAYLRAARAAGLALVLFAAPNAPDERLRAVLRETTGFLYVLGLEGVTGERAALSDRLRGILDRLRALRGGAAPPLAVGFGVSRPEHFAELSRMADGVIVGSALVRRAGESPAAVGAIIRELRGERR